MNSGERPLCKAIEPQEINSGERPLRGCSCGGSISGTKTDSPKDAQASRLRQL